MSAEVKKSVILPAEMWERIEASMSYRGIDSFNQWARMAFMNEIRMTDHLRKDENNAMALFVNEMMAKYKTSKSANNEQPN